MKIHLVQIPEKDDFNSWNKDYEFGFFVCVNGQDRATVFETKHKRESKESFYESKFNENCPKGFEFIGVSI